MNRNNVNTPKEPWLAVTLSTFLAGIGQIYSRRIGRGCVLICLQTALFCLASRFVFSFVGDIRIGIGLFLLLGIIHIWNLFDAYKCAKRRNTENFEVSRKENKDPWLAVFLSSWLPGLGQLYIRKRVWGVVFILCFVALLIIKKTYLLYFFGLLAILTAFVCYHAYISTSVHREASRRPIVLVTIAILCWRLFSYTAFPLRKYFIETFRITAGSMEPTLIPGDRILVRKDVKYNLSRGDVVVLMPSMDFTFPWVKRAIAFEGESIEIKDKHIYIDGEELVCPPLHNIEYVSKGKFGVEGKPFVVLNNSIFVLGDNSSNSMDSRFFGSIPEAVLIGKAYKIYWPLKRMGPIE